MLNDVKTVHLPLMNMTVKLGAVKAKSPPRVPKVRNYLMTQDIAVPASLDYYGKARASLSMMYLNNVFGCCVPAGECHSFGVVSANDGQPTILFTDGQVQSYYFQLAAVPGQDSGCVITDVLDFLCSTGFVDRNGVTHKLDGYCAVDNTNKLECQVAAMLLGGLTIGFNVTNQMVNAAREGAVWDTFNANDIAGGHEVIFVGYNATGVQVATWGVVLTMTWGVFMNSQCVTELYAKLAQDWYGSDKVNAATGFDATALKSDLDKLRAGVIPDPTPPAPPPIPVPPTPVPPAPVPPTPPGVFPTYDLAGSLGDKGSVTGVMTPRSTHLRAIGPMDSVAGSWLTDIGAWATMIVDKASELVAQYGDEAKVVLDAAKAFADAPSFDTAAALWSAIRSFGGVPAASGTAFAHAPTRFSVQDLETWAQAIIELLDMVVAWKGK